MLVYFSAIWYMLLSFGKLYVHLVHFVVNFGTFLTVLVYCTLKIWQPWCLEWRSENRMKRRKIEEDPAKKNFTVIHGRK
jgi:hypothetical protein